MIKCYRITKYNPDYRKNGVYSKDEWTSISDVGKTYDGELFTIQEYEKVEKRYLNFYNEILAKLSVKECVIKGLEDPFGAKKWRNNQIIKVYEIEQFIKECLREECWGTLKFKNIILIRFGYDFYTYLHTHLDEKQVGEIAEKYSLFSEEMKEDREKTGDGGLS